MDKDAAIRAAIELIKRDNRGEMKTQDNEEIAIDEGSVIQYDVAWIIAYNTRDYLEHGEFEKCIFPGVIVVPTDGTAAHYAPGTPPVYEYIDEVQRMGGWRAIRDYLQDEHS